MTRCVEVLCVFNKNRTIRNFSILTTGNEYTYTHTEKYSQGVDQAESSQRAPLASNVSRMNIWSSCAGFFVTPPPGEGGRRWRNRTHTSRVRG